MLIPQERPDLHGSSRGTRGDLFPDESERVGRRDAGWGSDEDGPVFSWSPDAGGTHRVSRGFVAGRSASGWDCPVGDARGLEPGATNGESWRVCAMAARRAWTVRRIRRCIGSRTARCTVRDETGTRRDRAWPDDEWPMTSHQTTSDEVAMDIDIRRTAVPGCWSPTVHQDERKNLLCRSRAGRVAHGNEGMAEPWMAVW